MSDMTILESIEECIRLNANIMKIVARGNDGKIVNAVIVLVGDKTAAPILGAIEALEAKWEAEEEEVADGR